MEGSQGRTDGRTGTNGDERTEDGDGRGRMGTETADGNGLTWTDERTDGDE